MKGETAPPEETWGFSVTGEHAKKEKKIERGGRAQGSNCPICDNFSSTANPEGQDRAWLH